MKIKLADGTEYTVVGANNKGNTVEIELKKNALKAEKAEEVFGVRENLSKIEVYETTKKISTLLGYVVLAEVRLKAGVVTVVLTKEADKTEQRITDAATKAADAVNAAAAAVEKVEKTKAVYEQVVEDVEQLKANLDYLAMEMGVEL